ncbi:MAG: serine hydrolase domain-containing protein [Gemmatimonadales bacterium]|nr:serine hydrolase domain-containing protein [Gemmatimonadales bacterium]
MLLLASAGARPLHSQAPDSLTARMARALTEEGLVGVAWSLVTPDSVTLGAAGIRDLGRNTPMLADNRVQVGSVAKTIIATGVLVLATEGRVDLDAPVAHYLPRLPIDNPWQADAPLLVRHLLDHTGGLADVHLWQVFTMRGDPDSPLRSALGPDGSVVQVRTRPGSRFSYSNVGYLILGLVIEEVTGKRYEQWIDESLLAPIGMHQSTAAFVSQEGPAADTLLAMGHFEGGIPAASFAVPVRPASQFTTTAADMALLARFLMSDGVVDGRTLVDSTLLAAMAVPFTTEAVHAGLVSGYALGLLRRERWGITGKCHLGNIGIFRAILCLYPEQQRAFFASYNIDPESANFDRLDSLLAATLGVPETAALPVEAPGIDPAEWSGWYLPTPNRFAQFAYLDEVAAVTRIAWDGEMLLLRPFQGAARALQPVGGPFFRLEGRRSATHVLARSDDGTPIVSDGLRTFERVSRARILSLWLSALAGLLGLGYLLLVGIGRSGIAWRHRRLADETLRWASGVLLVLVLAPLLYLTQPMLAIGDPTVANLAMALLTGLLPLAIAGSLVLRWRRGVRNWAARFDVLALVAALQWCAVLAWWGLLPLMLWR